MISIVNIEKDNVFKETSYSGRVWWSSPRGASVAAAFATDPAPLKCVFRAWAHRGAGMGHTRSAHATKEGIAKRENSFIFKVNKPV
jgi:hypothetical protein